jgi:hypothetical protein
MISPKRSGLTALVVAALLASTSTAHAALTTPACLAKKLKAWGTLRRCQAIENGEALQGRESTLPACQTTFNNTLTKIDAQAKAVGIACRYGVNGDGTATDYDTGLVWEQKDNSDGTPNPADPHDADNTYLWSVSGGGPPWPPDGSVFTDFQASLNDCPSRDGKTLTGGFAGHCDWRLPSIMELAGILDRSACPTFASPCIDQTVFGPTIANPYDRAWYWSATTCANAPDLAFVVGFFKFPEIPSDVFPPPRVNKPTTFGECGRACDRFFEHLIC